MTKYTLTIRTIEYKDIYLNGHLGKHTDIWTNKHTFDRTDI